MASTFQWTADGIRGVTYFISNLNLGHTSDTGLVRVGGEIGNDAVELFIDPRVEFPCRVMILHPPTRDGRIRHQSIPHASPLGHFICIAGSSVVKIARWDGLNDDMHIRCLDGQLHRFFDVFEQHQRVNCRLQFGDPACDGRCQFYNFVDAG